MHIGIISVGTRGDAQPYVAVGRELLKLGHPVTLVTNEDHRALAESNGLGFRPICGNFRELLGSPEGTRWITSSDRPMEYLRAFADLFGPLMYPWTTQGHDAMGGFDAVLVHSMTTGAMVAAEALDLPMVVLSPFAWVPTRQMRLLRLPGPTWLTGRIDVIGFRYLQRKLWEALLPGVERYRRERGLPQRKTSPWAEVLDRGVRHLHVFSEAVLRRPTDWPACAEVTGYCFLDAPSDWQPPDELTRFIDGGRPPVYIGFGSMTGLAPEVLAALTREVLDRTGQRAIIGMGWGGMRGFADSDDVLIVNDVPHEWLFPKMAAIVHHGGAGTTAAGLRAGRPNVVVPFFADQPAWGDIVARQGAGPAPVLKKKLTADRLTQAITEALGNPSYARRAGEIAAKIASENGARQTAIRALAALGQDVPGSNAKG